jgi:hypothetical protein
MPRVDSSAKTVAVASDGGPRMPYEPPQLTVYGPAEKLTKELGGSQFDGMLGESAL